GHDQHRFFLALLKNLADGKSAFRLIQVFCFQRFSVKPGHHKLAFLADEIVYCIYSGIGDKIHKGVDHQFFIVRLVSYSHQKFLLIHHGDLFYLAFCFSASFLEVSSFSGMISISSGLLSSFLKPFIAFPIPLAISGNLFPPKRTSTIASITNESCKLNIVTSKLLVPGFFILPGTVYELCPQSLLLTHKIF